MIVQRFSFLSSISNGYFSEGVPFYRGTRQLEDVPEITDGALKRDAPFEFLDRVAKDKKGNLSDIIQLNLIQKEPLLTLNNIGRVQLTDEAFDLAGGQGFDANIINEGLKEQYLGFYSPEMKGNVLGSVVDKEFANKRLELQRLGLKKFGIHSSTRVLNEGFLTDSSGQGELVFPDFGFKDAEFLDTDTINLNIETLGSSGISFERASTNIFTKASRGKELLTGDTLKKNILTGARIEVGSERANKLLGIEK